MMTIDRPTGETIARLMHLLRPEWDLPGCVAAVKSVARRPAADVAIAAVRLAATKEARNPGALAVLDGPHWREKVAPPVVRHPPRKGEDCRNHPGEWPESCRGCRADSLVGDTSSHNPRLTPAPETTLQLVRAELAQARARLCSHGVPHTHCAEKHATEEDL